MENQKETTTSNVQVQKSCLNSKEDIIFKAIQNINLDKSSMFKAKNKIEYDCALEDLKVQIKKIQDNASTEAYNNFRSGLAKWYRKTEPYLKYSKSNDKVNKFKPTDEEMGLLTWYVEGVKVSKSVDDVDNYFDKIDQWFEAAFKKYPKKTVQKLYSQTSDRLSKFKQENPNVEKWLRMVAGCVQNEQVDNYTTDTDTTQQDARKCQNKASNS